MGWTASICDRCWLPFDYGITIGAKEERPFVDVPVRVVNPIKETCVFCGKTHSSGIYVRVNPKLQEQLAEARNAVS